MPRAANDWTVEQVLALPNDGNRYEVVDGELLVSPAPELPHQDAVLAIVRRLDPYVRSRAIGHLSISPADVQLDQRTLVQPDIFVFETPGGRRAERWTEIGRLLLAVEILSPGTARYDRQVKRVRYQRQGIPEYWIVDLDSRIFERWRPRDDRPEVLHERIEWAPGPSKPGLVIEIEGFFREVFEG
jgi:Uma2 family endonuclease